MGPNEPLSERIIELRKRAISESPDERRAAREALAQMIANASDDDRALIVAELRIKPRGDFTI